jgi:hypothetical protein
MKIEAKIRNSKKPDKIKATAKNKVRSLRKELLRNPNNRVAQESLKFWEGKL